MNPLRFMLALLLLGLVSPGAQAGFLDWWLTPDQQGQRLANRGKPAEAATRFSSPDRIGAALFEAGEFEQAAAVFGRVAGPEGAYNRGNALVFLGRYEEAIASYELALSQRPGWEMATQNRDIARVRLAALAPPEDDYGGTGGKLGADEIVLDSSGRTSSSDQEQVVDGSEQGLDDASMRALWLRRVETRPADFLAAKFNYQLATAEAEE